MFCRKKKNNKRANVVSEPSRIKSDFENNYVEIKQLASQFSELSRFAHDINDIGKEWNGMANMQRCSFIKRALGKHLLMNLKSVLERC